MALRGRIGALVLHSRHDPRETTAKARVASASALNTRLLNEIDPQNLLPEEERQRRLDYARAAHFARLALKSAQARRAKAGPTYA